MAPETEADELLVSDADTPGVLGYAMSSGGFERHSPPVDSANVDPVAEIETKVAPRVGEARLIKIVDQATLDAVGDRLAANKALQKQAAEIFDPVVNKAHEAHKAAIAARKKVTDPLVQEETILKSAVSVFVAEQRRIQEAEERRQRELREAEERRLLAEAEEKRKAEEARINEEIRRQHEQEVEAQLDSLPEDAAPEVIDEICNTPAPAPVHVPLDVPAMPVVPAAAVAPSIVLPKGMAAPKRVKAEVTNLSLLCRAIGEGKASVNYVTPNMSALNARAKADGAGMNVPGVKVVEETGVSQRGR